MNAISIVGAVVLLTSAAHAQVVQGVSRAEVRSAMISEFKYVEKEKPTAPGPDSPILKAPESIADADTVVMEKMVVTDSRLYWDLASDLAKSHPPAKAQSHHTLGTGTYEKDFGKTRFGCVTVLYVPVLVGLSW